MKGLGIRIAIFAVLCTATQSNASVQEQKSRARLYLTYHKYSPSDRYLNIKVITRENRRSVPVEDVKIDFYLGEKSGVGHLGSLVTDAEGQGSIFLPLSFYSATDTLMSYNFIASLKDNPDYLEADVELEIIDASIEVHGIEQDSKKIVQAVVRVRDSTNALVVMPEVPLSFLVQRPLSLLPISELTQTDDKGMAASSFPNDLPGDREGYVNVVVKIDDHEPYGTVLQRETLRWGIPTHFDDVSNKRSLWAARANTPIPLLLLVNGLILVTWGIMIYIARELLRIRTL